VSDDRIVAGNLFHDAGPVTANLRAKDVKNKENELLTRIDDDGDSDS